jgi:hypothetical protein
MPGAAKGFGGGRGLGILGVGMQWNRREYIYNYRKGLYIYNSIFLFTSTFPMILYNENISKWRYVDVFGI